MKKIVSAFFVILLLFVITFVASAQELDSEFVADHEKLEYITVLPPEKTVYNLGYPLKLDGLVVIAHYVGGYEVDVTELATVEIPDFETTGVFPVKVEFEGKVTTFDVTMLEAILEEIGFGPVKKNYAVGQTLQRRRVTAYYSDGTSVDVTDLVTYNMTKFTTPGEFVIVASYMGKTDSYEVTVVEKYITSISVTPPTKTTYTEGDTLDLDGMIVTGVYTDESEVVLTDLIEVDTTVLNMPGTVIVTVTYNKKNQDTFTVTVEPLPLVLESITLSNLPFQKKYTVGDTLSLTGLVVMANYTNGEQADVTNLISVTPTILDTLGTIPITVSYEGMSATFEVTVVAPFYEYFNIVSLPDKLVYKEGEEIDLTGLVLEEVYSDGSTYPATGAVTFKVFHLNPERMYVIISYEKGGEKGFDVTVIVPDIVSGDIDGTNIHWRITYDKKLVISGTGAIPDYMLSSHAPWREYYAQIGEIVVEEGIERIGKYAFNTLENVTSITVADSVKEIGSYAFRKIDSCFCLEIYGVEMLEYGALASSTDFYCVYVSEKLRDIRGKAFASGTMIVGPEGSYAEAYVHFVEYKASWSSYSISFDYNGKTALEPVIDFGSAGDEAFWAVYDNGKSRTVEISGSGKVKNFAYHESAKNVASDTNGTMFSPFYYMRKTNFADVKKITALKVHDGLTNIGNYLFYGMNKATTVEIGSGVTEIGCNVFWACPELDNVVIPEGVTAIKRNVFNGCTKLKSLTLPSTLTEIGANIFIKAVPAQITVTTTSKLAIDYLTEFYPTVTIVQK